MALAGRRFVQHPKEMRFPHGATFASGQVSTTGFLTQALVDNAVAAHLRADEVVSLKRDLGTASWSLLRDSESRDQTHGDEGC